MSSMPENKHLRFIIKVFYVVFALAVFYIVYKYMMRWLLPFIIAFIVAACIQRPVRFLCNRCRFPAER